MKKIHFKKSLLVMLFALLTAMSHLSYTHARTTLQDVYAKIDTIADTKPLLLPRVEQQLQSLINFQTDPSKKALLNNIYTYILSRDPIPAQQAKMSFEIGSHIDQAPAGYKTLSVAQMTEIANTVHLQGDDQAPIWVLEFIDFQCPYCQRQHNNKVLDILTETEYPGKVRSAAVMFPLTGQRHELATQAAESAQCAYIQGGTDAFYAHKDGLYAAGLQPTMDTIRRVATNNGLDADALVACMDAGQASTAVQAQKTRGRVLGVTGTPGTVVIDMRTGAYQVVKGAVPVERFMPVIEKLYRSVK